MRTVSPSRSSAGSSRPTGASWPSSANRFCPVVASNTTATGPSYIATAIRLPSGLNAVAVGKPRSPISTSSSPVSRSRVGSTRSRCEGRRDTSSGYPATPISRSPGAPLRRAASRAVAVARPPADRLPRRPSAGRGAARRLRRRGVLLGGVPRADPRPAAATAAADPYDAFAPVLSDVTRPQAPSWAAWDQVTNEAAASI
mgnify:CR=1 FL=1